MEYECLSNICFKCEMYGHGSDLCLGDLMAAFMDTSENDGSVKQPSGLEK